MSRRGALVTFYIERELVFVTWAVYDEATLRSNARIPSNLRREKVPVFFPPDFDRNDLGAVLVSIMREAGVQLVFGLTIFHATETNANIRRIQVQAAVYSHRNAERMNVPPPMLVVMVRRMYVCQQ